MDAIVLLVGVPSVGLGLLVWAIRLKRSLGNALAQLDRAEARAQAAANAGLAEVKAVFSTRPPVA